MDIPDYLKPQIAELDKKIEEVKSLASDPSMSEMAGEEIKKLEEEKLILINSQSNLSNSSNLTSSADIGSFDNRNIILEIRGAAGGVEAKMWGDDLLRMYSRFA